MQNLWITGLLLAALVGSGVVVGMGVYNDRNSMDDSDYDCWDNNNCPIDNEECEHHTEEYCEEYHEECDYHHTEFYGCC